MTNLPEVTDRVQVTHWGDSAWAEQYLGDKNIETVPLLTQGTVWSVDRNQIAVRWDNGGSLNLIPGHDQWQVTKRGREAVKETLTIIMNDPREVVSLSILTGMSVEELEELGGVNE